MADEVDGSGRTPVVEEVLRCFTEPTLALLHGDHAAGYFRMLVGRSLSDPDQTVRQLFWGGYAGSRSRSWTSSAGPCPTVPVRL